MYLRGFRAPPRIQAVIIARLDAGRARIFLSAVIRIPY
jgi:hypothetical protein